jgi:hypothetical protein
MNNIHSEQTRVCWNVEGCEVKRGVGDWENGSAWFGFTSEADAIDHMRAMKAKRPEGMYRVMRVARTEVQELVAETWDGKPLCEYS